MSDYEHILLATDLRDEKADNACRQAKILADKMDAKLSIIHVVEQVTQYAMGFSFANLPELEKELIDAANSQLSALGDQLYVSQEDLYVEVGYPKIAILDKAKEIKADLIILGVHDRHGLGRLLGSTANAILQRSSCDVLTVHL